HLLDAAEAFLVATDVVLERAQQALGVPRRRDDARPHTRARRRRLDVGEVEDELVLVVVDEDEVRIRALRGRIVDVDLDLRGARGVPLDPGGEPGRAAKGAEAFAARLRGAVPVPVELVDESFSTVEAEEVLLAADVSRARRREVVDKLAAAVILRRWLDARPR